jgi:lysophospholipase L1-like esterase
MNWFALEFANGRAFFYGLILVAVCSAWLCQWPSSRMKSVRTVLFVLGAILVLLSATPIPYWIYTAWFVLLIATVANTYRAKDGKGKYVLHATFLTLTSALFAYEFSFHLRPAFATYDATDLYVVGDSLAGGADRPENNWPELLATKLGMTPHNFSFGGAKVRSALHNAERIDKPGTLVVLEIGGNDLLAGTPPPDFESGLRALLENTCKEKRHVIMIELPLIPTRNAYGAIQRKLAAQYHVPLVPKRYLASVLGAKDATMDGLHLSNQGHALLADELATLFSKSVQ